MLRPLGRFVLAGSLFLGAVAQAQNYGVVLSGANENPTVGDPAGSGFAVVSLSGTTVTFYIFQQGIGAVTAGHIHQADQFSAGPVRVPFTLNFIDGFASGTVSTTPEIAEGIRSNPAGWYVNLHTAAFPGGAIRGQLQYLPTKRSYFPTVVKASGLNNTNFVTDVSFVNVSSAATTATLDFYQSNTGGLAAPTATRTVAVPANSQVVVKDLLGSLFGASGDGSLRVSASPDVFLTSRVFNDQRSTGGGTSGLLVPAGTVDDAVGTGILPLLSQAAPGDISAGNGFRTNVGYFNPLTVEVTVTFTARRKSDNGVIGTKELKIPAGSRVQRAVFDLIDTVADADRAQDDFYVTYTLAKGHVLFVYAAVVDNRTGDGIYIPGTPLGR